MTSESSHIPWVPKDMEWFIADLIQEFTFANGDGPLVWVNQILIRANSLEEAYENSLARGAVYNSSYLNSDGVQVTERFRGLRDLYLIYDKLEDGAEILYTEYDDLDETRIAAMITPKERLAAFVTHDKRPEKSRVEEGSESNVPDDALAAANGLNQSAQSRRDAGDFNWSHLALRSSPIATSKARPPRRTRLYPPSCCRLALSIGTDTESKERDRRSNCDISRHSLRICS